MEKIIITLREFRLRAKYYFDCIDEGQEVIISTRKKAYKITPTSVKLVEKDLTE